MSSNLGVIVKKRESSRYYRTFSHLAQREFPNRGLTNSQLYTKYSKCSDKNKHLTRRKRFLHLGAIGTALGSEPARTLQNLKCQRRTDHRLFTCSRTGAATISSLADRTEVELSPLLFLLLQQLVVPLRT